MFRPDAATGDDGSRRQDVKDGNMSVSLNDFTALQLLDADPRPTLVVADNDSGGGGSDDDASPWRISHANKSLVQLAPSLYKRLKLVFGSSDTETTRTQRRLVGHHLAFLSWAVCRYNDAALSSSSSSSSHCHRFAGYSWTRVRLGNAFFVLSANVEQDSIVKTGFDYQDDDVDDDDDDGDTALNTWTEKRPSDNVCIKKNARHQSSPSASNVNQSRQPEMLAEHTASTIDGFSTPILLIPSGKTHVGWTDMTLTDATPSHVRCLRLVDWTCTPLGAMERWHWDLRAAFDMLIRTPYPAAMYWGPQFVIMYNEAYVDLAGHKHPQLLGTPYAEAWAEIWHLIEPVMLAAWHNGQSTIKHNDGLFISRSGFLEETYFSWSLVPLLGSTGQVAGIFNAAFETTQQVVNERRLQTLQEVGQHTGTAKALHEFWSLALRGLANNEADFPFCLIYSAVEEASNDDSSLHSKASAASSLVSLQGSLGVPDGHPSAPLQLDMNGGQGFAPYMRQSVANGGKPMILSKSDGTLPAYLIQDLEWLGFGEPSRTVVVFAVTPMTSDSCPEDPTRSRGFVVVSVNPRRPYDSAYELFISLLMRQLATSLASVLLFEDQVKRSEREVRLAALDCQRLSLELHQRTQEAVESEYKFSRMAQYAPVGIFIADCQGHLTFCNGMWWQLSRQNRLSEANDGWMDNIVHEDRSVVEEAWRQLLVQKTTVSLEFRFRSSSSDFGQGDDDDDDDDDDDCADDVWVLMRAFPEKDQQDNIRTIFGCITDISAQKEAENLQSKRREEALELKRQQENFIDITSHEMRNPLSAILQCADQIIQDASDFADTHQLQDDVGDVLKHNVEAAKTINLCASHQKRIVDDILTLSKLDSKLMTINPVQVAPVDIVRRVLAMFESESNAHDICLTMTVDKSYADDYEIDTVNLDPARLQQVLINLVTNAIKFTKGCRRRSISVTLGADHDGQSLLAPGHAYIPIQTVTHGGEDHVAHQQSLSGETVCLLFTVQDSGIGLDEADLNLLFERFQQSSPRTHVQYGGSGLGLFISRLLVEMMGGEIGVCSDAGGGSRFFFYIKCQRLARLVDAAGKIAQPVKPIARRVDAAAVSPSAWLGAAAAAPPPPPPDGRIKGGRTPYFSILIVEDNLINQRVLKRQVLRSGHWAETANHGQEALEMIARSDAWLGNEEQQQREGGGASLSLSVILMDVEMPVMDGLACSRRIRELEASGVIVRHLPIIAVTAYARPSQIDDAKAAGVDDVMPKPFRIAELMPKIAELVCRFEGDDRRRWNWE